jgi:DHA2 family multidrug resistance protein-like MFS transporter
VKQRSGALSLVTLIWAAAVANLNLAVANVALPAIGSALDATQVGLNMVAVGFTLGLAASVLYLGALGDRYGRKPILVAGLTLSIPLAAMAAWAPTIEVLVAARLLSGVAAGMVYPTTLALIVALYDGQRRTQAIALWSGIGAGASALGPVVVGWLLTFAWWGAAFAISIPVAAVALVLALLLPRHLEKSDKPVDNIGGLLSIIMVATLIAAITFAPMPNLGTLALVLSVVTFVAIALFVWRQKRATNPIFNLDIAKRRLFWVAAIAGIIVFGSLMGSFFIGQQFLQNVLGYTTFQAGAAVLPSAVMMIAMSPVAGALIPRIGSRNTLIIGFLTVGIAFALMFTWTATSPYLIVGVVYAFLGSGVALAAAPASRSIMSAVPARELGMGSAMNDLQRDLGGAIMQAIMGSLLVARYAGELGAAFATAPADQQAMLTDQAVAQMSSSFAGAESVAASLPQADQQVLIQAAQQAFTSGSNVAFVFALAAVGVGLLLVAVAFPKKEEEFALEAHYASESTSANSVHHQARSGT